MPLTQHVCNLNPDPFIKDYITCIASYSTGI